MNLLVLSMQSFFIMNLMVYKIINKVSLDYIQ